MQCYLELHIEQGAILDKAGIPIGVVEGIVSIDEYAVEIRGVANHAGTTPMADRRNALLAGAKLIEAVQEIVTREPGRQVGTVGQLEVSPNAVNVVPGLVKLSIELRDLDAQKIDAVLIFPDDQIPDDLVARLKQQLAPKFTYIDCRKDGHVNAGLFVRKQAEGLPVH